MAEVRRVLKPGGRFVAEMGGHGNVAAIHVGLRAVLDRHGFGNAEHGVNYYPTPEAYTRRLERHGFKVERIALIPRPTPLPQTAWRDGCACFAVACSRAFRKRYAKR